MKTFALKLYRFTHPIDSTSYILAKDIQDSATKAGPLGAVDTVDKIEWVRELEITSEALAALGDMETLRTRIKALEREFDAQTEKNKKLEKVISNHEHQMKPVLGNGAISDFLTNKLGPATLITCTDSSGFEKDQRWLCKLPKEYGGDDIWYAGENIFEAHTSMIEEDKSKIFEAETISENIEKLFPLDKIEENMTVRVQKFHYGQKTLDVFAKVEDIEWYDGKPKQLLFNDKHLNGWYDVESMRILYTQ